MENKVQQALAVMDKNTGQLFNYRQLIRNPRYKKEWKISASNKFGQLAQGVGGRIKGTNTIKFIFKHEVPKDGSKMSCTGNLSAPYILKSQRKIVHDS